jgi:hypothetical protein
MKLPSIILSFGTNILPRGIMIVAVLASTYVVIACGGEDEADAFSGRQTVKPSA